MSKIAIATPIGLETGGPEALHQLCHTLRKFGQDAYLLPWEGTENNLPVKSYSWYDAPIDTSVTEDTLLIAPETVPELILKSKRSVIWWLSVENSPLQKYPRTPEPSELNSEALFQTKQFWEKMHSSQVMHFSQSFYAKLYLRTTFGIEAPMLTDYINNNGIIQNNQKKEIISFSHKGAEFYKPYSDMLHDFHCIQITGMTKRQTIDILSKSRLYVDLGNQPGRDRMPREAALHHVDVMVNLKGAGGFYNDAPLTNEFKFDLADKDEAIKKIKNTLNLQVDSSESQLFYRDWVKSQHEIFEFEVWKLLRVLG
jgi:hypothetical protein